MLLLVLLAPAWTAEDEFAPNRRMHGFPSCTTIGFIKKVVGVDGATLETLTRAFRKPQAEPEK